MEFFWVRMACNAFRIVLECRPDQSLTHRDVHVCWSCHTWAPKCPLCCEDSRQKVVLMKKPSLHNSWSWKCVFTLRMVGNEKAFFLSSSAGTHPLPPSTIPGGFKSSEEYAQVKLDYAPNKETVSKKKSDWRKNTWNHLDPISLGEGTQRSSSRTESMPEKMPAFGWENMLVSRWVTTYVAFHGFFWGQALPVIIKNHFFFSSLRFIYPVRFERLLFTFSGVLYT